jgi:glutamyl-tRNA synthetase
VLRIDDTDAERNVEQALQPILHGFRWLGIDWDEGPEVGGELGPYYQSQRKERHQAAVCTLIEREVAYRDYATTEELQVERDQAKADKRRFVYSRKWMAEGEADCKRFEAEGRKGVVRLKMPRYGSCRFRDLIRGDVEVDWELEQDHVIQRADGSCLYNLATVVDDHEMQITHVIRAEEHLSNTPRQIFISRGLGLAPPEFAHLPFVAEPGSKNKLSKRKLDKYLKHAEFAKLNARGRAIADAIGLETSDETFNPVIVDFYEQVGFEPEALVNYLLLLGWALDDKTEFFTRERMIEHFSLERVSKAAAGFDPQKLLSFQQHYMTALPVEARVDRTLPFLEKAGIDNATRSRVAAIVEAAGDRIKIAGDILDYREFFVADDALTYDDKVFEKRLRKPEEAAELLRGFRDRLQTAEAFDAASLDTLLKEYIEAAGVKIGQVIHALRVAVTGKAVGFGMFETLAVLGKESCVARIDRALAGL